MADGILFGPAHDTGSRWQTIERQVHLAKRSLSLIGRLPSAFSLISCPTCGRCEIDITDLAKKVDGLMVNLESDYRKRGIRLEETGGITVAVMGCNVNGPGEARGADIGIAGGRGGTGTIFMGGRPVATLQEETLLAAFENRLKELVEERLRQGR
jgi:(E)-4-hydroxy-3-methylbut-2-enyl-diphosphate synthase